MRTHGTPEELENLRRRAVAAVLNGETQTDVARIFGVSDAAVSRWVNKVESHGGNLDSLAAKPHPGPKRLLSPEDELRLVELLKKGSTAHGWENELWTASRVRVLIERHFKIDFHVEYVRTLLKKRLRWTSQRPQTQAKKRDAAAVERWKNEEFQPFFKISPGRTRNPGVSR